MQLKRWSIALVLMAFLATVVGVGLEGAWAQGEPAPISVSVSIGQPTLVAKGAAVNVPVIVTCTVAAGVEFREGWIYVHVEQAIQPIKLVAVGDGNGPLTTPCDGVAHATELLVRPNPYNGTPVAFRKGVALITAYVPVAGIVPNGGEYGTYVNASDTETAEVKIK
jgi:hypothetical protein